MGRNRKRRVKRRSGSFKKAVKIAFVLAIFLSILVFMSILLMPTILSSNFVKNRIVSLAEKTLKRNLHIEKIAFTWFSGIEIQGFRIDDDPEFSTEPVFQMEKLTFKQRLNIPGSRKFEFGLEAVSPGIHIIQNGDGRTNIDFLKELSGKKKGNKETASKEPSGKPDFFKTQTMLPPIFTDLTGWVHFRGCDITVEDRLRQNNLHLSKASVFLDMPSLTGKPIILDIKSGIRIDDREMPPLELNVRIADLMDDSGTPRPEKSILNAEGKGPGFHLKAAGGLNPGGLEAAMHIDLGVITDISRPFLPERFSRAFPQGECVVNLQVREFAGLNGKVTPEKAVSRLEISFPGVAINVEGRPGKKIVHGKITAQIDEVYDFLASLLPDEIPPMETKGRIQFDFEGNQAHGDLIAFQSKITAGDLSVRGGNILKENTVGPVFFLVRNNGTFDPKTMGLFIGEGDLEFLSNSRMNWRIRVPDVTAKTPKVDFRIPEMNIDITELFAGFREFVPFPIETDSISVKAENVRFSGTVPAGSGDVSVEKCVLSIPGMRMKQKEVDFDLSGMVFSLKDIEAHLFEGFPESASINGTMEAESIRVNTGEEVKIREFSLPSFTLTCEDMARSDKTTLGLTGIFGIRENARLGRVSIGSGERAENMRQSAGIRCIFSEKPEMQVQLTDVTASVSRLSVPHPEFGTILLSGNFQMPTSKIEAKTMDPLQADVSDVKAKFKVSDFLTGNLTANAKNLGRKRLDIAGNLSVDLAEMVTRVPKKLMASFKKARMSGSTDLRFIFQGRLPNEKETGTLQRMESFDFRKHTEFLDRLKIEWAMKNIFVDAETTDAGSIEIGPLNTRSPVKYDYRRKDGSGELSGNFKITGIRKVPGRVFPDPLTADVHIHTTHKNLGRISFSQALEVEPFHIRETYDLDLFGLDRVLRNNPRMPLPRWLEYVGGNVKGSLVMKNDKENNRVFPDIGIMGNYHADIGVQVLPGRSFLLTSRLKTEKGIVVMPDVRVDGIRTDMTLEKKYTLDFRKTAKETDETQSYLSGEVLNPVSQMPFAPSAKNEQAGSMDIRRPVQLDSNIGFDAAKVNFLPNSANIGSTAMHFDFGNGLPRIEHFRMEAGGGTIGGHIILSEKSDIYYLDADIAFSGIDGARLFSDSGPEKPNREMEMSGNLFVSIPLTKEMTFITNETRASIRFTHIGRKALERVLYALDPTGSDENIVSTRKLIRTGSPRWITIRIRDGNISLRGKVDVKGVLIDIPGIQRLNIGNLSGLDRFSDSLDALTPVIEALNITSAPGIRVFKDGNITFEK